MLRGDENDSVTIPLHSRINLERYRHLPSPAPGIVSVISPQLKVGGRWVGGGPSLRPCFVDEASLCRDAHVLPLARHIELDPISQGHKTAPLIFENHLRPILVSLGMYPRILRRHDLVASDLFYGSFEWHVELTLKVPIILTEYSTRS